MTADSDLRPHPRPPSPAGPLTAAVDALLTAVAAVTLPLDLPTAASARHAKTEIEHVLTAAVLPRLRSPAAPLLTALAGPTGVGKSALLNALAGEQLSATGPLRPTTRTPVLACHPADLAGDEAGESNESAGEAANPNPESVPADAVAARVPAAVFPFVEAAVCSESLPRGIVLVDTDDGDRAGVVGAADAVVVVVSAERYADAAVWRVLRGVAGRGVPVAVVLGRVRPAVVEEVGPAFAELLRVNGLGAAPLFVVEEVPRGDDGLGVGGPAGGVGSVAGLWEWLRDAGADTAGRERIGRLGVGGRLDVVERLCGEVAGAWEGQRLALEVLQQGLERVHTAERVRFRGSVDGGELFGGEVRIRWQEVLGSGRVGALFGAEASNRGAPGRSGKIRKGTKSADWSTRFHNPAGYDAETAPLRSALVETVARAYRAALERAARKTADQWELTPGAPEPRVPDEAARRAGDPARAAAAWLDSLPGAIRDQARSRRTTRTIGPAGAGIRSAALVLGVTALAGGDGTEPAATGRREPAATAALGLLRTMFGAEDAERLLVTALSGLKDGNARLLDSAAEVQRRLLAGHAVDAGQIHALNEARAAVAAARGEDY